MNDKVKPQRYTQILELQKELNIQLQEAYELNKTKGREHLGGFLISYIEKLVNELNEGDHDFGRCSYDGDINFENSEQTYCDGRVMGTGVILHFHGFSVLASWEGYDRYSS